MTRSPFPPRAAASLARAAGLVLALALAACRQAPTLDARVSPPAVAPGEPLRVDISLRHGSAADLEVTLADAGGTELARANVHADGGRAQLWLDPAAPRAAGDLRLGIVRTDGKAGRRRLDLAVPLDADRPVVQADFLDGFHAAERTPGGSFRWTTGCALAEVEDPGGAGLVHIAYSCGGESERTAWLRISGGEPVALACGDAARRVLRVPVAHAAWSGTPFAPVEIVVDPPFRPAELGHGDDVRELGLRVFGLIVTLDPSAG